MFHEKKEKFIKMPIYEGGQKALNKFISENINYPSEALLNKIEGTVQIFYIIETDGSIIQAKPMNNLGYGCDEEAVRVIKLLKYKIPKNYKFKATFNKKINIHFKLPKQLQPTSQDKNTFQIQYNITPSNQSKQVEPQKISYNIEIKLNN